MKQAEETGRRPSCGPSSAAIPTVPRFLSNQLPQGSCRRSPAYSAQTKCRSAAWLPAEGSKIPVAVNHGSPRESSTSEPSDLVQLGRSVVIVADAQNAGSALGISRQGFRVGRHYAWLPVGPPAPAIGARIRCGRDGLGYEPGAERARPEPSF
jgi:hypothetical protein